MTSVGLARAIYNKLNSQKYTNNTTQEVKTTHNTQQMHMTIYGLGRAISCLHNHNKLTSTKYTNNTNQRVISTHNKYKRQMLG